MSSFRQNTSVLQFEPSPHAHTCLTSARSTSTNARSYDSEGHLKEDSFPATHEVQIMKSRSLDGESQQQKKGEETPLHKGIYEAKRGAAMEWLQTYSAHLKLSRDAASLAQVYTDLFFDISEYQLDRAIRLLSALLIVASKYTDTQPIQTSLLAYLFDLEVNQLSAAELEVCWALDFDLTYSTYTTVVDDCIQDLRVNTGINLYEEDQSSYLILRIIHFTFQKAYIKHCHQPTASVVKSCLKQILRIRNPSMMESNPYFEGIKAQIPKFIEQEMAKVLDDKEWESSTAQKFKSRKSIKNYEYEVFSTRYYQ